MSGSWLVWLATTSGSCRGLISAQDKLKEGGGGWRPAGFLGARQTQKVDKQTHERLVVLHEGQRAHTLGSST